MKTKLKISQINKDYSENLKENNQGCNYSLTCGES